MLKVTAVHPGGEWTQILGLVKHQLEGIELGKMLAMAVKQRDGGVIDPLLFVLIRRDDFNQLPPGGLAEWADANFPDEHHVQPIILRDVDIEQLRQGKALQWSKAALFKQRAVPTGWHTLRDLQVRYGEDEEALMAGLEGKDQRDLR